MCIYIHTHIYVTFAYLLNLHVKSSNLIVTELKLYTRMYNIAGTARICVLFSYMCTCVCVHECVHVYMLWSVHICVEARDSGIPLSMMSGKLKL